MQFVLRELLTIESFLLLFQNRQPLIESLILKKGTERNEKENEK